jgi:TRAP-type transport system periplasmic protein
MNAQSNHVAIALAVFWAAYLLFDLVTQSARLTRIAGGQRCRSNARRPGADVDPEAGPASLVIARRVVGGIVLGGVPCLAAFFLRLALQDIGVRGSGPLAPGVVLPAMTALVPLMILLSRSSGTRATYPLIRAQRWSFGLLAANTVSWAFFLAGYELCFRGFLLLALARAAGEPAAIAIVTVAYSATHLRRGHAETLGSMLIGVAFAWLTLRTGTIWAAWLGHLLIACTTEAACLIHAGSLTLRHAGPRRVAAALVILCLAGPTQAQTIKLGTLAPAGSPWEAGLRKLAADWSRLSAGRVSLKVYPGGVVGDEDDMLRKVRVGQLNAVALSGPGLSTVVPGVLVLQVPQLVWTDDELDYLMRKMNSRFAAQFEQKGFKLLAWTLAGWAYVFARDPVIRPDDLRKQRLWVWQGRPDEARAWRDLGFQPVTLASTDVLMQLQTGGVDAFVSSPLVAAANQYFALADDMTELKLAPFVGGVIVSLRAWESMPADLKPALEGAVAEMTERYRKDFLGADAEAIAVMKSHGLSTHPVSDADRDAWRRFFVESAPALLGSQFDGECYATAQRHLEELRSGKAGR